MTELSPKGQALLDELVKRGSNGVARRVTNSIGRETEIVYNEDQLRVYAQVKEFLKSTDISCRIIGAAGTGKTTLLKKVIQGISSIAISAPTHAAKLQAGLKSGIRTVYTVAELAGLNPDVDIADFDPAKPTFAQKREPKIKDHKVHIIDEASMLNLELKKVLEDLAEDFGVQLIFTGDACQLPPVGEDQSTALQGDNIFELHTIIRQEKSNPLTYLLAVLRYMQELYINNRNDTKERFDEIHELIESFTNVDYNELYNNRKNMFFYLIGKTPEHLVDGKGFKVVKTLQEFYNKAAVGVNDGGRLLAFTNDTVAECNTEIRRLKGFSNDFEIGEILTSYKTLRDDKNNMYFVNSLDYKIVGKQPKISMYDFQVIRLELIDQHYLNRTFVDVLHKSEYDKFMTKYWTVYDETKSKGGAAWPKFFLFKDAHCFCSYNNLAADKKKRMKADLEYGYGITIHKSQGSTYKYAYVRVDDIFKYTKTDESYYGEEAVNKSILFSLKLLYVALSRATDVALMYV